MEEKALISTSFHFEENFSKNRSSKYNKNLGTKIKLLVKLLDLKTMPFVSKMTHEK